MQSGVFKCNFHTDVTHNFRQTEYVWEGNLSQSYYKQLAPVGACYPAIYHSPILTLTHQIGNGQSGLLSGWQQEPEHRQQTVAFESGDRGHTCPLLHVSVVSASCISATRLRPSGFEYLSQTLRIYHPLYGHYLQQELVLSLSRSLWQLPFWYVSDRQIELNWPTSAGCWLLMKESQWNYCQWEVGRVCLSASEAPALWQPWSSRVNQIIPLVRSTGELVDWTYQNQHHNWDATWVRCSYSQITWFQANRHCEEGTGTVSMIQFVLFVQSRQPSLSVRTQWLLLDGKTLSRKPASM